jgi:hypothetical protein
MGSHSDHAIKDKTPKVKITEYGSSSTYKSSVSYPSEPGSAPPLMVHVSVRFALVSALVASSGLVIVTVSKAGPCFLGKSGGIGQRSEGSSAWPVRTAGDLPPTNSHLPATTSFRIVRASTGAKHVGTKCSTIVGDERKSIRAEHEGAARKERWNIFRL